MRSTPSASWVASFHYHWAPFFEPPPSGVARMQLAAPTDAGVSARVSPLLSSDPSHQSVTSVGDGGSMTSGRFLAAQL